MTAWLTASRCRLLLALGLLVSGIVLALADHVAIGLGAVIVAVRIWRYDGQLEAQARERARLAKVLGKPRSWSFRRPPTSPERDGAGQRPRRAPRGRSD